MIVSVSLLTPLFWRIRVIQRKGNSRSYLSSIYYLSIIYLINHTYEGNYYKELAHMILEADKSQDLPSQQAGDPGELMV